MELKHYKSKKYPVLISKAYIQFSPSDKYYNFEVDYPKHWVINDEEILNSEGVRIAKIFPGMVFVNEPIDFRNIITSFKLSRSKETKATSVLVKDEIIRAGTYDVLKLHIELLHKERGVAKTISPYFYFVKLAECILFQLSFILKGDGIKQWMSNFERIISTISFSII